MTLVDTSIWIDHFRSPDRRLASLLHDGQVMSHPFVIGELALGQLRARSEILALLADLPRAPAVDHDEVLSFINANALAGSGLGWVEVNLLASVRLAGQRLWTRDRRLAHVAQRLGVTA